MPILSKYLPLPAALSLLTRRELWYRCPLSFEPWDCRADLLENLDVEGSRLALRRELERILCDSDPPSTPDRPEGLLLHAVRAWNPAWTAADVDAEYGDLFAKAFEDLSDHRNRIRREQELVLRELRVLCLCACSDEPAMWTTYADKGRGACIGLQHVPTLDNAIGAARPVSYVDRWPAIATPIEWARHVLFCEEIPFGKRAGDALYVKRTVFAHEREWRVITKPPPGTRADEDGTYRAVIEPSEVAEVVLGPGLSASEKAEVRAASRSFCPDAEVRSARVPATGFGQK